MMEDRGVDKFASSLGVRLWVALVRLYQLTLASLFGGACRFYPSCSDYSRLAVEKYGFWQGFVRTLGRIARCQPFARGGFDFP